MTFKAQPLPRPYEFLNKERFPAVLIQALMLHGVLEDTSSKSNALILSWAAELGENVANVYRADDIPWCGLFMGIVVKRAGYEPPKNMLWALSWAAFGRDAPVPMLGDVLVFTRNGGGHVGLYVGEDAAHYYVLGGNQADSVCITRIVKTRLYCARRCPFKNGTPANVRVIHLSTSGPVSGNES